MPETTPPPAEPGNPVDDLRGHLTIERALNAVRVEDELAWRQDAYARRGGFQALRDGWRDLQQARHERRRDAKARRELAALHRQAAVDGSRAQLATVIHASAEARALRVRQVRTWTLRIGVPVLAAFGAWSTVGVHQGVTALLGAAPGSPWWWGAWLVEPAIIAVVAGIIVVRAVLRASGGDVDWRAHAAHWGALAVSIMLNLAGHWPTAFTGPEITQVLAHSVGPLGAATVAWMIGVVDDYVRNARPEQGAPTLNDLGLDQVLVLDRQEPNVPVVVPPVAQPAPTSPAPVASAPRSEPEPQPLTNPEPVVEAPAPAPKPTPERRHRTMSDLTDTEWEDAVTEYRFAVLAGNPLSGRELCRRYGINPNNRSFPRRVQALAEQAITEPALDQTEAPTLL